MVSNVEKAVTQLCNINISLSGKFPLTIKKIKKIKVCILWGTQIS